MPTPPSRGPKGRPRPERGRQRAQTWLFALAFLGLLAVTVAGAVLARAEAIRRADERLEMAAERGDALLESELRRDVDSLVGAATIVGPDGQLSVATFERFAGDVLGLGVLDDLMLLAVDDAGTGFEVLSVQPEGADGPALGSDFGADPAHQAALTAALQSEGPTFSRHLDLGDGAIPGLTVAHPVIDRGATRSTARGLVITRVPVDRLVDALEPAVGEGYSATVTDGDEVVLGPPVEAGSRSAVVSVVVVDPPWMLTITGGPRADLTLARFVAVGGSAAILALVALVTVTVRHQRRVARANALLATGQERTRAVQEVAGRLARALSGDDVVAALVDHLPTAAGAASVVVATDEGDGDLVLLRSGPGADQGDARLPVGGSGSIVEATLTGREPAWLSSPLLWRHDEAVSALAGDGWAVALLPLAADDVAGVLAVSYSRVHLWDDDERALLETVGVLAARALARGRRYDAEHQAALAFQHAALPGQLPSVDGLAIAARYRPGAQRATVGGDWYDVLLLDDHQVLLVVGDVVGHGMEAAAAMGRLRTAFQAIAPLRRDPGPLVQAVSQQVALIPNAFCTTVVCAVIDLTTSNVRWARAGHPPPVLLTKDGARLLDEPGLPPLGVRPEWVPPVHEQHLGPGDVLLLYTDGVVERRDEPLDASMQRLCVVAEALADLKPHDFSDALLEALVPAAEQLDDVALLVVQMAAAGAPPIVRP
ncbi:MAG: SpoIIE family protein phosphatase [Acidimicrobiales bacterium]